MAASGLSEVTASETEVRLGDHQYTIAALRAMGVPNAHPAVACSDDEADLCTPRSQSVQKSAGVKVRALGVTRRTHDRRIE